MDNVLDEVKKELEKHKDYVSSEGEILKAKVYSDINSMKTELIEMLFNNKIIKKHFFVKVKDSFVFDKQAFLWFLDSKEFLPNSYTKYTNNIGLVSNNSFISLNSDVVLDFPYKDCVLEGGQTREDQKRDEVFYNEIIASDEISTLLSPKVFTNAIKYEKNKKGKITKFDENDNLIIKGNNLIAISSLLKRYEGKVKLIIIDPPYNTNTDSFLYNDSFSHSTWLVFMKNRLEIAKKLLSEDGSIYVQIDNKEAHYLKVLMDDVFGRNNFRSEIIWDTSIPYVAGNKWLSNNWIYSYSSIFYYAKSKESVFFNKLSFDVKQKSGDISHKPYKDVWTDIDNESNLVDAFNELYFDVKEKHNANIDIPCKDLWNDIENFAGFLGAKDIKIDFNSRKPEKLIERMIKASSNEGDLVLDFFAGSGTTLAVAHKMNRKYIGIEQMDDQIDIITFRLNEVIKGEDKGISKSANWQGGGSFIYCELKEYGKKYIDEIIKADKSNIDKTKKKILSDEILIPYLTKEEVESCDKEFEQLSLKDKKQALISLIDKNKLYINYSDIDDKDYRVTQEEQFFTKSFYEGE